MEAQSLEATAMAHAEAQAHNMAHAQNLAAKAHSHAQQAHSAQAQAQVKAVHAHSLQVQRPVPLSCARVTADGYPAYPFVEQLRLEHVA